MNFIFALVTAGFSVFLVITDSIKIPDRRLGVAFQLSTEGRYSLAVAFATLAIVSYLRGKHRKTDTRKIEYAWSKPSSEKRTYYRTLQGEYFIRYWYLFLIMLLTAGYAFYSAVQVPL